MFATAEVIETSIAFENAPINDEGNRIPLGTIRIRVGGKGELADEHFAFPALNTTHIPLIGEHVICFRASSDYTNPGFRSERWFYLSSYNLQGNKHLNPLPNKYINSVIGRDGQGGAYASLGAPQSAETATYIPGEDFTELDTIKNLQPYEGDIIFQGRAGASLRLGRSYQNLSSQYAASPFWKGDGPITILSNGLKEERGPNKYVIEDPDTTASMFIMTSGQQIKMKPSQRRLAPGIQPVDAYKKSQIVITSDRLIFNSKLDEIVLSSKSTVGVATKNWAVDMNTFFDLFDEVLDELLAMGPTGANQFITGVGPTVGNPALVAKVSTIKAKLGRMRQ